MSAGGLHSCASLVAGTDLLATNTMGKQTEELDIDAMMADHWPHSKIFTYMFIDMYSLYLRICVFPEVYLKLKTPKKS